MVDGEADEVEVIQAENTVYLEHSRFRVEATEVFAFIRKRLVRGIQKLKAHAPPDEDATPFKKNLDDFCTIIESPRTDKGRLIERWNREWRHEIASLIGVLQKEQKTFERFFNNAVRNDGPTGDEGRVLPVVEFVQNRTSKASDEAVQLSKLMEDLVENLGER